MLIWDSVFGNELSFLLFVLFDCFAALLIFRHFGKVGLICLYIVHVLLVQMTIQVQFDLFGYTAVAGSMLFAVLFMITDVLTEHYGKKEGYTAVGLGAAALIIFLIVTQVVQGLEPSANSVNIHDSFSSLFAGQLRITLSDLVISYVIFQSFDVWLYDKIHKWTKGRMLWLRNIGSTFVSQTLIAVTFFQVAFVGTIDQETLWQIIIAGLVMKLFIALLDTPFVYLSYRFIPKKEMYYKVSTFEGKEAILNVWQDIEECFYYDGKGEVLLSGVEEKIWIEKFSDELKKSLDIRKKLNITTRLLIKEGDHNLTLEPRFYRAIPGWAFQKTPYYVYKDRVALINWEEPLNVTVIRNKNCADTFRNQFEFNWKNGSKLDSSKVKSIYAKA